MAATAFAGSPIVLAITLAATGLFAAIYHPIGTAMLVDASGDKPGRAIGVNGVFGDLGVALASMVTALLATQAGWRTAFLLPGLACAALGLAWLRLPAPESIVRRGARPFREIPRHLVRRAAVVLLLIAIVSGFGVQRLHAAAAEADGRVARR